MDKIYDVRRGDPLILDHEYAHCATRIKFCGFDKEHEESTVYLLFGQPLDIQIALDDDNTLLITSELTQKPGTFMAQLQECQLNDDSEYEYIRYSDIFDVVIAPSLATNNG